MKKLVVVAALFAICSCGPAPVSSDSETKNIPQSPSTTKTQLKENYGVQLMFLTEALKYVQSENFTDVEYFDGYADAQYEYKNPLDIQKEVFSQIAHTNSVKRAVILPTPFRGKHIGAIHDALNMHRNPGTITMSFITLQRYQWLKQKLEKKEDLKKLLAPNQVLIVIPNEDGFDPKQPSRITSFLFSAMLAKSIKKINVTCFEGDEATAARMQRLGVYHRLFRELGGKNPNQQKGISFKLYTNIDANETAGSFATVPLGATTALALSRFDLVTGTPVVTFQDFSTRAYVTDSVIRNWKFTKTIAEKFVSAVPFKVTDRIDVLALDLHTFEQQMNLFSESYRSLLISYQGLKEQAALRFKKSETSEARERMTEEERQKRENELTWLTTPSLALKDADATTLYHHHENLSIVLPEILKQVQPLKDKPLSEEERKNIVLWLNQTSTTLRQIKKYEDSYLRELNNWFFISEVQGFIDDILNEDSSSSASHEIVGTMRFTISSYNQDVNRVIEQRNKILRIASALAKELHPYLKETKSLQDFEDAIRLYSDKDRMQPNQVVNRILSTIRLTTSYAMKGLIAQQKTGHASAIEGWSIFNHLSKFNKDTQAHLDFLDQSNVFQTDLNEALQKSTGVVTMMEDLDTSLKRFEEFETFTRQIKGFEVKPKIRALP